MNVAQLLKDIDELLDQTVALRDQDKRPTPMLILMVAAYRRSYDTMKAIRALSESMQLISGMGILVRSLLEDVINIEYMLAGDKDAEASKFNAFIYIQQYDELRYLRELDAMDEELEARAAEIEKQYENYKPHFLDKKGRVFKSWNNKLVGQMIRELKTNPKAYVGENVLNSYAKWYQNGNQKAHFNPVDVLPHLYLASSEAQHIADQYEWIGRALHLFAVLTGRYADELAISAGISDFYDIGKHAKKWGWGDDDLAQSEALIIRM